jgi:hypothetical protein
VLSFYLVILFQFRTLVATCNWYWNWDFFFRLFVYHAEPLKHQGMISSFTSLLLAFGYRSSRSSIIITDHCPFFFLSFFLQFQFGGFVHAPFSFL